MLFIAVIKMVSLYKTVSIFVFFILFFSFQSIHSLQLALPNSVIAAIGTHIIYVKNFSNCYCDNLFSSGIKDNIITCRSVLNKRIGVNLLLVNVTLSIKTKIGFVNNQFLFPEELIRRNVFLFQHTNFIT